MIITFAGHKDIYNEGQLHSLLILIECKDYKSKIGLNTLRSALGLKEDVNNFEVVDVNVMQNRRNNRRGISPYYQYERYSYQIAVASMSGFTAQAQEFALTHRISLIDFTTMPFWNDFLRIAPPMSFSRRNGEDIDVGINDFVDEIGGRMAVAITNLGQMLFLYKTDQREIEFDDYYMLHWQDINSLWTMSSGNDEYYFALPEKIRSAWLEQPSGFDIRENAINCKATYFSNMVVYYIKNAKPTIKMISISPSWTKE